jgi:transcriptional regulator with XRE-family HTH domain
MTSTNTLRNAPQFSDLLRNWRKIRKISQWNLSLEAGISQRHLSFLESGRSSPSRDMVMLLARSLELPFREQNGLLNSAGFTSIYSHSGLDEAELEQARHALEVMLKHHEPYPAFVIDRNWNILMMNEANIKVFSLLLDPINVWNDIAPGKPPNVLRLTLHPKGLKPFVTNWIELAAYFVNQLTTELAMNPYNTEAKELMDEI